MMTLPKRMTYAAGLKSVAWSVTLSTLSATVGAHGAHSPSPHFGYPHAGQIANDAPSAKMLIATTVPSTRGCCISPLGDFKPDDRSRPAGYGEPGAGPGTAEPTICGTGPGTVGPAMCGTGSAAAVESSVSRYTLTGTSVSVDGCGSSLVGAAASTTGTGSAGGGATTGAGLGSVAAARRPSTRTPSFALRTNVAHLPPSLAEPMRHATLRLPAAHPAASTG
jgi:hypothetical protein